jgi:hypothetical protein
MFPIQRFNDSTLYELRGEAKGRTTGLGVRLWSQRPRRRHVSENQQPQTKVRRRLTRMLGYNELMSILFFLSISSAHGMKISFLPSSFLLHTLL